MRGASGGWGRVRAPERGAPAAARRWRGTGVLTTPWTLGSRAFTRERRRACARDGLQRVEDRDSVGAFAVAWGGEHQRNYQRQRQLGRDCLTRCADRFREGAAESRLAPPRESIVHENTTHPDMTPPHVGGASGGVSGGASGGASGDLCSNRPSAFSMASRPVCTTLAAFPTIRYLPDEY